MCDQLTSTQEEVNTNYRNPRFLHDELTAAADISTIDCALKINVSSTAHGAMQKIATLLYSEPGTADSQADAASKAYHDLSCCFREYVERKSCSAK